MRSWMLSHQDLISFSSPRNESQTSQSALLDHLRDKTLPTPHSQKKVTLQKPTCFSPLQLPFCPFCLQSDQMLPDWKRFLPKYTLRMFNMPQFPFGQRWYQKRGWKEPPEPPQQWATRLRYLLSCGAGRALCFWGWWMQPSLRSRLRRSQVMSRQTERFFF